MYNGDGQTRHIINTVTVIPFHQPGDKVPVAVHVAGFALGGVEAGVAEFPRRRQVLMAFYLVPVSERLDISQDVEPVSLGTLHTLIRLIIVKESRLFLNHPPLE